MQAQLHLFTMPVFISISFDNAKTLTYFQLPAYQLAIFCIGIGGARLHNLATFRILNLFCVILIEE